MYSGYWIGGARLHMLACDSSLFQAAQFNRRTMGCNISYACPKHLTLYVCVTFARAGARCYFPCNPMSTPVTPMYLSHRDVTLLVQYFKLEHAVPVTGDLKELVQRFEAYDEQASLSNSNLDDQETESDDAGTIAGKKGVKSGKRKNHGCEAEQSGVSSRKRRKTKKTLVTKPATHSSSFKRGGNDVWVSRDRISASYQVPTMVADVITSISATSIRALTEGGNTIIQTLVDLVTGKEWVNKVMAFQVDSIHSISTRCQRAEEMMTNSQFVVMLNMMQLTTKLERLALILNFNNTTDYLYL